MTSTLLYLSPRVTSLWSISMFEEIPGELGVIVMGIGIASAGVVLSLLGR